MRFASGTIRKFLAKGVNFSVHEELRRAEAE